MSGKYALYDGAVLCEGRKILTYEEVCEFMGQAVLRRIRKRGDVRRFLYTLAHERKAEYAWDFLNPKRGWSKTNLREWWRTPSYYIVTTTAEAVDGGYRLCCINEVEHAPRFVLERVNQLLADQVGSRRAEPKKPKRALTAKKMKRSARRLAKRLSRQNAPKQVRKLRSEKRTEKRSLPRPQKIRERVSLDEALETSEREQFRNQHVSWREAIKATAVIFSVKASSHQTCEQVVAAALFKTLEESGGEYIEYSYCGYTLRFCLMNRVRGWQGDITPMTIFASKQKKGAKMSRDKKKIYARMRTYFSAMFGELTIEERRARKCKLLMALAANDDEITMSSSGITYKVAC